MGLAGLQAVAPYIGMIVGPMLAGLTAPEGQELSSFEGKGAIDPVTMLNNVNQLMGRIGQGVTDRAATPVSLPSAYVQQPGVMAGGGMPMPIGLVGTDPALANPSLLSLQGLGQFQNIFNTPFTGTPNAPPPPITTTPTDPNDPSAPGPEPNPGPTHPGEPNFDPAPDWMQPMPPGYWDNFPTDPDMRHSQPEYRRTLDAPQHVIPVGPDQGGPQGREILTGGTLDGPRVLPADLGEGTRLETRRKKYGQLVRAADVQPGDDLDQAIGAVNLLLQNMQ